MAGSKLPGARGVGHAAAVGRWYIGTLPSVPASASTPAFPLVPALVALSRPPQPRARTTATIETGTGERVIGARGQTVPPFIRGERRASLAALPLSASLLR
jgi:hypothetical protein